MKKENLEQLLVLQAKNGNAEALNTLLEANKNYIYAIAFALLKNKEDAEDAMQQALITVWHSINTLENTDAFENWLYRIAHTRSMNILKSRKNSEMIVDSDIGEDPQFDCFESELMLPQEYAERNDLKERLFQIIDSLSAVQRETIVLHYFHDKSVSEIAEIMECSQGTVKSRLYLARNSIKAEIEEQEKKHGEKFFGIAIGAVPMSKLIADSVNHHMLLPEEIAKIFRLAQEAASVSGNADSMNVANGAKQLSKTAVKKSFPLAAKIAIASVGAVALVGAGVLAANTILAPKQEDNKNAVEETTIVQTTAPPSTQPTTEIPTEGTTQEETQPSTSPDRIGINDNLLSDIGRTYGEIEANYGKGSNINGFEGELFVKYENAMYHFRAEDIRGSAYSDIIDDEVIPDEDAVCYRIDTDAKALFNDFADQYSVSDIEQELGVSASTVFSDFTVDRYLCHFEYKNCDISITLDVNGNEVTDKFSKDSDAFIALKGSFPELYGGNTASPSPTEKISVNENLLSVFGLTYEQIKAKYGEETYHDGYSGGVFYKFEHGLGSYFFRKENGLACFADENGNFISPPEDATCFTIFTDVKTLFNHFEGSKSISEMEKDLGISIEYYDYEGKDTLFSTNKCAFEYGNYGIMIDIEYGIGMTVVEDAMAVISIPG